MRRELTPSASAPAALPRAMSSRRNDMPSWRWKAMTWPPESTTTQDSGFIPASLPLAKAAVMMVFALSRLIRKSLIGGALSKYCYIQPDGKSRSGKATPGRECAPDEKLCAICRPMGENKLRKTQIVVVGGGAAGLELATRL